MKQETIYDRLEKLADEKWTLVILMHDLIAMAVPIDDFQKHQLEKARVIIEDMEKAK